MLKVMLHTSNRFYKMKNKNPPIISPLLKIVVLAALSFNSACSRILSARAENVVVVSSENFDVGKDPLLFNNIDLETTVDGTSSVCIVLRNDLPFSPGAERNKQFNLLTGGVKLNGFVVTSNGERITLDDPLQAWSSEGRLGNKDELSACMDMPLKSDQPIKISTIGISTEQSRTFEGIYWWSH